MPPLLVLGGISGAGMLTLMDQYRPIIATVTFGLLGYAFYLTYRPSERRVPADRRNVDGGRRSTIMAFNKLLLWGVTAIAVIFLIFPQTISGLTASSDQITSEMHRTVIRIEGMT